jgi:hypothetical protein
VKQWGSDEELFDTLRRDHFTAVIGDVMDTMGLLRQFLPLQIKALRNDMVVTGRAMTVLEADVFAEWEVDEETTEEERRKVRENRVSWPEADPEELAQHYRDGEIGAFELIGRHGVILDWGTGELLPKTTEGFRAMLNRRVVPHWENGTPKD